MTPLTIPIPSVGRGRPDRHRPDHDPGGRALPASACDFPHDVEPAPLAGAVRQRGRAVLAPRKDEADTVGLAVDLVNSRSDLAPVLPGRRDAVDLLGSPGRVEPETPLEPAAGLGVPVPVPLD